MKKKTRRTVARAAGVGAAVAAGAAAVLSAYFLSGKRGKKTRAKLARWAHTMRRDALRQVKRLRSLNKRAYDHAIEHVAHRYRRLKDANTAEVNQLVRELKGHWKHVEREAKKAVRPPRRRTPLRSKRRRTTKRKTKRLIKGRKR